MVREEFLYFEKLTIDHVKKMMNWGLHESELFKDYNFNFKSEEECRDFLIQKTFSPLNKYYAIVYSEEVIGFIGVKGINLFSKSSTLGLVLNPSLVGMGYGTVALKKFLNYYFFKYNMKRMDLIVANYNPRARKLYENMGFKPTKTFLDRYPNKRIDEDSEEVKKFRDQFVYKGDILYNYCTKMELHRKDFKFEICN